MERLACAMEDVNLDLGLNIYGAKTNVMATNGEGNVALDGTVLEIVNQFKFLKAMALCLVWITHLRRSEITSVSRVPSGKSYRYSILIQHSQNVYSMLRVVSG